MKEIEKKHIIVELVDIGIKITDKNIKGFSEMRMNFQEVKNQISEWLESVGTDDEELETIKNMKKIKFKFSKKYDTWFLKFGKEYIVVDNSSNMRGSYESESEEEFDKGDDFYEDYIMIDGDREIYLINNNKLSL